MIPNKLIYKPVLLLVLLLNFDCTLAEDEIVTANPSQNSKAYNSNEDLISHDTVSITAAILSTNSTDSGEFSSQNNEASNLVNLESNFEFLGFQSNSISLETDAKELRAALPTTAWLFLSGLLGILRFKKQKNNKN